METCKNTDVEIVDTIESISKIDFNIYNCYFDIVQSTIAHPDGITINEICTNDKSIDTILIAN